MIPKAKTEGLEVEDQGDHFLVTDNTQDRIIRINRFTTLVWMACDGMKSPWEIQSELESEHGVFLDEDTIWMALTRLNDLNLLFEDDDLTIESHQHHFSSEPVTEFEFAPI